MATWYRVKTRPVAPAPGRGREWMAFADDFDTARTHVGQDWMIANGRESLQDIQAIEPASCGLALLCALAETIQNQTEARLAEDQRRDGYPVNPWLHFNSLHVTIKEGRKFWNIDVGSSGKYMVDKDDGTIYGIKAYGVVHRGHSYGTLQTTAEWKWGGYVAER
jgi:hypothetical protein